jgi:hypothetical protein
MAWARVIPEKPQEGSLCQEHAPVWLRDVLTGSQRHTLPGPDGNGIQFKGAAVPGSTSNGLAVSARVRLWR